MSKFGMIFIIFINSCSHDSKLTKLEPKNDSNQKACYLDVPKSIKQLLINGRVEFDEVDGNVCWEATSESEANSVLCKKWKGYSQRRCPKDNIVTECQISFGKFYYYKKWDPNIGCPDI